MTTGKNNPTVSEHSKAPQKCERIPLYQHRNTKKTFRTVLKKNTLLSQHQGMRKREEVWLVWTTLPPNEGPLIKIYVQSAEKSLALKKYRKSRFVHILLKDRTKNSFFIFLLVPGGLLPSGLKRGGWIDHAFAQRSQAGAHWLEILLTWKKNATRGPRGPPQLETVPTWKWDF